MSEKRREKRIPSTLPIKVRTQKETLNCVSMNVSRTGIGFLSERMLNPGPVSLEIAQTPVKGRILYRKGHGKGAIMSAENVYQYGVQLSRSITQEQLDRWVFVSRMPSRGQA
ncbi:MAG: PilZ domain-containing protein [Leptospiraceae bacterium]|nr:PilZ domain-containing protein [Leptospiraceae bacterium]